MILAYEVANAQFGFGLPLQVRELFGADGPRFYGMLASLAGLVVVVGTTPLTRLTARLSHTANMALGGLLYAAGFGMIGLISRRGWFLLAMVVWTSGEIAVATNMGAYIASNSPASQRGRYSSFFETVRNVGLTGGPLLMGWVVEAWGVRMIWPLSFAVLAAASWAMFKLGRVSYAKGNEVLR